MATWPSGTKASTGNLDAGTDSPRLARADIKQNVDNVNSIIDMFNIDSPSNNQVLKYSTSNARFELGTDDTGSSNGITFSGDDSAGVNIADGGRLYIQGGTNITTSTNSDGTLTIDGPDTSSFITDNGNGDLTITGSTIASPSNANLTLQPSGTGDIDADATFRFNQNYKEDINSLTSSSTITVDCSLAPVHTVTLGVDTGFVISNLPTGGSATIIITQDGAGSRTATFGTDGSTTVKFAGGTPTLSTAASSIDVVTIFNDGTNYLGSIAKAFAA